VLFLPLASAWLDFLWESDPYYYSATSLPAPADSACCGSDLIPDPSVGRGGPDCLCDVTDGGCDTGCCCDVDDCPYDAYRAGGFFGCTTNGTVEEITGYTTCSEQLVSTNIPPENSGVVRAFGGENGLLCIVSENSPSSRGSYYRDPVEGTTLSTERVTREIDTILPVQYQTWLATDTDSSVYQTAYQLDDPVQGDGCISAASSNGCASLADVLLPARSPDGGCDGQQLLSFLRDIPPFSCDLAATSSTLESVCGTTLDAGFLQQTQIATLPSATTYATLTFEIEDTVTGSVSTGSTPPATSSYDNVTGTCSNALLLYQLRLYVGTAGTIDQVTAYVRLGTLTTASWTQMSPSYGAGFEYLDQQTQVRGTSGRPGYQRGLPLLIADGTDLRREGLRMLPRTALGECASGTEGATQALWREATAATCIQRMTASQLQASCVPVAATMQPLIAALNLTAGTSLKIGIYGDSHPEMPADWVDLNVKYPSGNAAELEQSWFETEQECHNVLSGIHLRVLFTQVGSYSAPIEKVVGAELVIERRTVAAARCSLGEDCLTTLSVTATTTFVSLDAERFDYVPDSPTVIPSLPYDFFYPFYVG